MEVDKDVEQSEGIYVAIRSRPLNKREKSQGHNSIWKCLPECESITQTSIDGEPLSERNPGFTYFSYDRVFSEEDTTEKVYDGIGRSIVEATLKGINGTIFAYGQTSSGKTFTMQGTDDKSGILQLAAQNIFEIISQNTSRDYLLRVSFLEIYNENIRDLLDPETPTLQLREDPRKGVYVDAVESIITDYESILELLYVGNKHRKVESTAMNERSSRSHTIFRMVIESKERSRPSSRHNMSMDIEHQLQTQIEEEDEEVDEAVLVATLNLVDLAGSESVRHTGASGQRAKEGGKINQSLLSLSRVIHALGEKGSSKVFVNFRDSKLTRILQPSLSGNAKMAIICCVTSSNQFMEETRSTLQFASRAKLVQTKATVNEVIDDRAQLRRLQRELSALKQKHLMMEQAVASGNTEKNIDKENQNENNGGESSIKIKVAQLEVEKKEISGKVEELEAVKREQNLKIERLTQLILNGGSISVPNGEIETQGQDYLHREADALSASLALALGQSGSDVANGINPSLHSIGNSSLLGGKNTRTPDSVRLRSRKRMRETWCPGSKAPAPAKIAVTSYSHNNSNNSSFTNASENDQYTGDGDSILTTAPPDVSTTLNQGKTFAEDEDDEIMLFSRAKFFKSSNGHTRLSIDGINCLTYYEDTEKVQEDIDCIEGGTSNNLSILDEEVKELREMKEKQEKELQELQELLQMNYEEQFQRNSALDEELHMLLHETKSTSTSDVGVFTDIVKMETKGTIIDDDFKSQVHSSEGNEIFKPVYENCAMRIEDLSVVHFNEMITLKESLYSKQNDLEEEILSLNKTMKLIKDEGTIAVKDLMEQIEQHKSEKETILPQLTQLQEHETALVNEIESLRVEYKKERSGLLQDIQAIKEQNESLRVEGNLDKENLNYNLKAVEKLEDALKEKNDLNSFLENEKDKMKDQLEKSTEEKKQLMKKIHDFQATCEEMKQSLNGKESHCKALNEELQLKSKKYSKIGLLTQSLLKNIDTKDATIKTLEAKYDQLKTESTEKQNQYEIISAAKESKEGEISSLRLQCEELDQKVRTFQEADIEVEMKMKESALELARERERYEEVKVAKSRLSKSLEELELKIIETNKTACDRESALNNKLAQDRKKIESEFESKKQTLETELESRTRSEQEAKEL